MSTVPSFPPSNFAAVSGAAALGGTLIATPNSLLRKQAEQSISADLGPLQHAACGAEALSMLERGNWKLLFLDRRLPDLDSDELMAIVRQRFPQIEIRSLDSQPEAEIRNQALPTQSQLKVEDPAPQEVEEGFEMQKCGGPGPRQYEPLPGMIGRSEAMQGLYRLARLVAPHQTTVLVVGPTGSGKELVARALHTLSPRAARAFVAVNCAAIPEALLESELFGYARGAFTGAVQAQAGRVAAAQGGTLFLDEVSELPLGMQAKLLRFLEQKEIQRLGTAEVTRVDARVIVASNVDLAARAGRGEFREDLFYRLSAFPLELPPLAERRTDIVPLAQHFLECMAAAMHSTAPRLSDEAVRALEQHAWKGNVRELQHVIERASILVEDGDIVLGEHIYFPFQDSRQHGHSHNFSCASRAS